MSSTIWKIGSSTTFHTLADLHVSSLQITFRNRAADETRIVIDGSLSGAASFSYGSTYSITKNFTTVFTGRCEKIIRKGTGSSQSCEVILLGGWHWLTLYMYQQSWPRGAPGTIPVNKSRVILGCDANGGLVSANAQISGIVACAGISAGTVNVSSGQFPMDEKVDITCAEALDAVLAWWPDAVVWFTYSGGTTLNVARFGSLSSRSVALASAAEEVQATARRDLQIPGVRLIYETTTGNGAYQNVETDEDGAPDLAGGLIQTISVAGSSHDIVSAKIVSQSLPATLTAAWWASRIPELAGWTNVTLGANPTVTLSDGTSASWKPTIGTKTLNYELLSGTVADWMHEAADRVRVTQTASYTLNDQTVEDAVLSIDLVLTSAETGVYQHGSVTRPETIPNGLAADIMTAVGRLYHEGTITLVGEDPPDTVGLGDKLLLTGGPAAWESMNAPIQGVTWDIATGTTRLSFGPPNHLGVQDLVARARANRLRGPARSLSARISSSTADDGIPLGGAAGSVNTSSGGGRPAEITVAKAAESGVFASIGIEGHAENTPAKSYLQLIDSNTGSGVAIRSDGSILLDDGTGAFATISPSNYTDFLTVVTGVRRGSNGDIITDTKILSFDAGILQSVEDPQSPSA